MEENSAEESPMTIIDQVIRTKAEVSFSLVSLTLILVGWLVSAIGIAIQGSTSTRLVMIIVFLLITAGVIACCLKLLDAIQNLGKLASKAADLYSRENLEHGKTRFNGLLRQGRMERVTADLLSRRMRR